MIQKLRLVRAIGQFESVSSALDLKKLTLVYAENARGKTTLAAILRSLGTGETVPIDQRRRLGTSNAPEAIIECGGGTSPARFQNGAWSRTCPDVLVFDDFFVDRNVYSGLDVDAEHRQNLHDLILGATGVALAQRVDQLAAQIRTHNTDLRDKANAIPAAERHGLNVDDFCGLAQRADIDSAIREAEQRLAALQNANTVQSTPVFQALTLPQLDFDSLNQLLGRGIPELDREAADAVKSHFRAFGRGAEEWISTGVRFALPSGNPSQVCPFCRQLLAGSTIFAHYRLFFGQAYTQLQADVVARERGVEAALSGDALAGFQRQVQTAQQRRDFWARFAQIPEVRVDVTTAANIWQQARDAIVEAMRQKRADPLSALSLNDDALAKIEAFKTLLAGVQASSDTLLRANAEVNRVKEATRGGSTTTAETDLKGLRATKARHEQPTAALCQVYLDEKTAKQATETEKGTAQTALDNYRAASFPSWQTALNTYLARLGANFTIARVESQPTGGRPSCIFRLLINGHEVPVGAATPASGHAFKTTLSAGDRNTLALAYFLAALDQDPNRAVKIVVLDDPMCSLDKHRRLQTIFEIRQLLPNVSQVIVMSHDEYFLFEVYDRVPARNTQGVADTAAITVGRGQNGSTIQLWDIESEKMGRHDKRHALLTAFHNSGAGDPLKVAQSIRPHLEHYLRAACPDKFRDGEMLRDFRNRARSARQLGSPIISDAKLNELDQLVEFSNDFHHDTNPAADTATINTTQLNHFVGRALAFVAV
jgi:wobble nucleotide-excising tRNase